MNLGKAIVRSSVLMVLLTLGLSLSAPVAEASVIHIKKITLDTGGTDPVKDSTSRDSVVMAPVTPTPPINKYKIEKTVPASPIRSTEKQQPKGGEKDDSILSFNFLYYIIEKYKLQDIVD